MGNHSGTPNAPQSSNAHVTNFTQRGNGECITKGCGVPSSPKNAAIPTNPSAPALPGLPSLPKPPTGTSNPAAPAKPTAPTAPTGKGIHFGDAERRGRGTTRGGRRHYNKKKEYGPFVEDDFTIGESVIIEDEGGKREGFISSVQPVGSTIIAAKKEMEIMRGCNFIFMIKSKVYAARGKK